MPDSFEDALIPGWGRRGLYCSTAFAKLLDAPSKEIAMKARRPLLAACMPCIVRVCVSVTNSRRLNAFLLCSVAAQYINMSGRMNAIVGVRS